MPRFVLKCKTLDEIEVEHKKNFLEQKVSKDKKVPHQLKVNI